MAAAAAPRGADMRAKHQRAGYLYKLPMSKPNSERWQRRLFVAKDGFLLYYTPNKSPEAQHFDTKVKGIVPLGGCTVEKCERGPKGGSFGLKVSHPDFYVGRQLVLACDSADEQKDWLDTLNDCARVTMENALLGDSLIERLRADGTTAEEERQKALEELQAKAMQLKKEREEKLVLQAKAEQTDEMKAKMAEMEKQMQEERESLEQQLKEQQETAERALAGKKSALDEAVRAAEEAKAAAEAQLGAEEREELEKRAQELEDEKRRLTEEHQALEDEMTSMTQSQNELRASLEEMSVEKENLSKKMQDVKDMAEKLKREQQQRRRLERKLQGAEDSLRRLDAALRRSGVKLDIDVFADVKTLKSFFEERVEEVRRDSQRINIMKQAINAKRRYLQGVDEDGGASASAGQGGSASAPAGDDSDSGDGETW